MRIDMTFAVLMPGSMFVNFAKLRIIRPAITSRTSESATSATTSTPCTRRAPTPAVDRLLAAYRASRVCVLDPWIAGHSPKMNAVTSETANVNWSTCTFIVISTPVGSMPLGITFERSLVPHDAISRTRPRALSNVNSAWRTEPKA